MTDTETRMDWTEERVVALHSLWNEGLSAAAIAARLGAGFTRNAVLGKVFRAKNSDAPFLSRAVRTSVRNANRPPTTNTNLQTRTEPRIPRVAPLAPLGRLRPKVVLLPPSDASRVTIVQLTDKTCRWPIGDPMREDFCFCGHTPKEDKPYCEFHCGVAYQAPRPRVRQDGRRA